MQKKHSKRPVRYSGYYECDERFGDAEPHFMAIMAPHDNGDGGFGAQIYAEPVSYILEFYPYLGSDAGQPSTRRTPPQRYHGYYERRIRSGHAEPECLAVMVPHANGDGGFTVTINATPEPYTLEFYPDKD